MDDDRDPGFAKELFDRASAAFVGRSAERARLSDILGDGNQQPRIICLIGEPGVGKSALASLFRLQAQSSAHRVAWISGETIDANRASLEAALSDRGLSFSALGRKEKVDVLVIDAFERVSDIGRWLFSESIARAGRRLIVLITSRQRLDASVRGDLAVAPILEEMHLSALSQEDGAALLRKRHIDDAHHAPILEATQGLPLALQLVAERWDRRAGDRERGDVADILRSEVPELALAFLRDTNSVSERQALYALSLVRRLDEGLLNAMVGSEAASLYDFLRGLSFVTEDSEGLAAHALVCEALHQDHHARNPQAAAKLAVAAARELISRVRSNDLIGHQKRLMDALYAMRELGRVRELEMRAVASTHLEQITEANLAEAQGWIEKHEGARSAELLASVMAQDAYHGFILRRGSDGAFAGMTGHVDLACISDELGRSDPMLSVAMDVAPTLDGTLGVFRWFFAADTYTDFGPQMAPMMFAGPAVGWSYRNPLGHVLFAPKPIEMWEPIAPPFRMRPVGPVFELDGPRQAFVRIVDPGNTASRRDGLVATTLDLALLWAGLDSGEGEALRAQVGADEVREALAVLRSPAELSSVRLVMSRPGLSDLDPGARASSLESWIRAGIDRLGARDAYSEFATVLNATYVEGAAKQRAAAAELRMPYGTYRHRLRRAVELLTLQLRGELDRLAS